ncbi:MAG: glycosyltransferase family 4 protein [Candidatus Roizmanbacteria bacterium]
MNTKKRLLFFSPYYHPYLSGMTTYPESVFRSLSSEFDITVLTFAHRDSLTPSEDMNGYLIIRMPYLFTISKGFIAPMSVWTFLIEARKHDLLILNVPNVEGTLLAVIARLLGKPLLAFFHCVVTLPPGLFNSIIGAVLSCANWIQLSLCTHVIGYTRDYCKSTWVEKIYRKKPSRFTFILPPVPDPVHIQGDGIPSYVDEVRIGFAGRVSSEKGLEVLIGAISEIQKANAKTKYSLQIAGPYGKDVAGENAYTQRIHMLLRSCSLSHHFYGTLSGPGLTSFYKSLNVFVLPSINQTEAFGMVQVDAMKCGIPVVVSDLPGVRVPVKLTGMGLVVQPRNEKLLAQAITEILKNRDKYTSPQIINAVWETFSFSKSIIAIRGVVTQTLNGES